MLASSPLSMDCSKPYSQSRSSVSDHSRRHSSSSTDAVIVCMGDEEKEEDEEMDVFSLKGSDDGDMGAVQRIAAAENSPEDLAMTEALEEEAVFQHCLYGVMVCAVRCPAYSKPLYRLAATAANLGLLKVSEKQVHPYLLSFFYSWLGHFCWDQFQNHYPSNKRS